MSEPDEIQFECIGCGTRNPASAEVCAGCGHRFAGTDVIRTVPLATVRKRLDNPYEPPTSPIAPPRTIRIGSILMFIAVVAVCLAAFREDLTFGACVSISLLPASIRTPLVAMRRRADGRPMSFGEVVQSFTVTVLVTWLVAFASLIAFVATCLPTGLATQNIEFAMMVGGVAVLVCAIWLTVIFVKIGRERAAREREIRYQ